jgi:hypothetical protein
MEYVNDAHLLHINKTEKQNTYQYNNNQLSIIIQINVMWRKDVNTLVQHQCVSETQYCLIIKTEKHIYEISNK